MNPRDFNTLAGELASAKGAAKVRSAISRAYYAAFHVGAQTLRKLGFSIGKGAGGHGEVARCFQNSSDPDTVRAAEILRDLHSVRIRADYQLDRFDIEQTPMAAQAVARARAAIDSFDRILTSPNRSQIQTAIATWRASNGYP